MLGIPVLFKPTKVLRVESEKAADSHEPYIRGEITARTNGVSCGADIRLSRRSVWRVDDSGE